MDMHLKILPAADSQGGAIKLELISIFTILIASVYAHLYLIMKTVEILMKLTTQYQYIYIQWLYLWRTKQI